MVQKWKWRWDDRRIIQDFFWMLWRLGLNKEEANMNDNWLKVIYYGWSKTR